MVEVGVGCGTGIGDLVDSPDLNQRCHVLTAKCGVGAFDQRRQRRAWNFVVADEERHDFHGQVRESKSPPVLQRLCVNSGNLEEGAY